MNRRRIALGTCAVGGAAALTAGVTTMVSSGGPPAFRLNADPVAAVRNAGPATAKAGTADVDTVVTMTTPAAPAKGATPAAEARTTTMHGTGVFDFAKEVGRIDLAMSNGRIQEVLTPASLYLRSQPPETTAVAASAVNAAKGWSRVDVGRLADGNVVSGGSTDPAVTVAMLGGVTKDVRYQGQDVVRGTAVAHYSGTLDLKDAANSPTATGDVNGAAERRALANAARAFTTAKVPFEAYLDDEGRLRRFVARFQFTLPGPAHAKADVTSATELYGFGVVVGVLAPSPTPSPTPSQRPSPTPSRTPGPTPGQAPGQASSQATSRTAGRAPTASTPAAGAGRPSSTSAPFATSAHGSASSALSPSLPVAPSHK